MAWGDVCYLPFFVGANFRTLNMISEWLQKYVDLIGKGFDFVKEKTCLGDPCSPIVYHRPEHLDCINRNLSIVLMLNWTKVHHIKYDDYFLHGKLPSIMNIVPTHRLIFNHLV